MRRALPILFLCSLSPGCTCSPPRGPELPPEHLLQQPKRDPSAELWALGHPDASSALVVADLRPLARALDDLRIAAAAAPRGRPALDHLDTMLRAACPVCPRRTDELEPKGLGPGEGLALFQGPGSERVLALGSLRAEATLAMLEAWLRRGDGSVRRRTLPWGRARLTVLDGLSPWYCRQVAARLVCGSAPRVLDAALARKPAAGLFERRIAHRFREVKRQSAAILYLRPRPLAPEVVALELGAGELRLQGYSRAKGLGPGPGNLLGLLDGADGVLRLRLPLAAMLRRGVSLPEELGLALRRAGIDADGLTGGLTGELCVFKRGPLDLSLALGVSDRERLRPGLRLAHRALQLWRFAQRFRGGGGAVELTELSREKLPGGSLTTIGLKVGLHELLPLPLPLTIEPRLYLALGTDCLLIGTDAEAARRALQDPATRPGDALWRAPDLRHLRGAFGEPAILSFWSRALDPLSGVPPPLAERLIDDALGSRHRDLKDAVQSGRFVADLIHDLTFSCARERGLQRCELLLRPLHVDDQAHRQARPIYLRALTARHLGRREAYQRALAEVIATSGATRYGERARMLAAGDPLTLFAALGATLASSGRRVWDGLRSWVARPARVTP